MLKKLILSIDEELIGFAHSYSRQNRLSVSKLFERYLVKLQTAEHKNPSNTKTASLYGVFHEEPIPDKKQLREFFHEKGSC